MSRIAKTFTTFVIAARSARAAAAGYSGRPAPSRQAVFGIECPETTARIPRTRPAKRVGSPAAPLVGVVRHASARARIYGAVAPFPMPAGYPLGGMASEQLRLAALHLATDYTGMIAVVIVASVLTWSRLRRGADHG